MTRLTSTFWAIAVFLLLGVSSLHARDLTAGETAALGSRIAKFEQAFEANDLDYVLGVVPPKLFKAMADDFGLTPAQLQKATVNAMKNAMASVTIVSYAMSTDDATAADTSAGRPYLLVPTRTVMRVDGTTMQSDTQTLAFADEGIWYLVRIDDAQQVQYLTRTYPEFEGVTFPTGTLKVIED